MTIDALTAYVHVEDVQRSVEFYGLLGLEVESTHEVDGRLVWALVARPGDRAAARLMLARASGPIDAANQGVLFYCWAPDVRELHDRLASAGAEVGAVEPRFYMPAGEFRLVDPDGYVVLIGQLSSSEPGSA